MKERKLRCLSVEDEELAARALRRLIESSPTLRFCGNAEDGTAAVRRIEALKPDVVFLDIRIPHLSGLDVLRRIRANPRVVFTTAYDEYAVTAFELGAVDYLLKPFGAKRFAQTVERLQQKEGDAGKAHTVVSRFPEVAEPGGLLTRFFVRRVDKIIPIAVAEVIRFEARGDYVAVVTERYEDLIGLPLSELEKRLDPALFLRVHRSCLANISHINRIVPHDDRRLKILFQDGSSFVASRQGSTRIRELVT